MYDKQTPHYILIHTSQYLNYLPVVGTAPTLGIILNLTKCMRKYTVYIWFSSFLNSLIPLKIQDKTSSLSDCKAVPQSLGIIQLSVEANRPTTAKHYPTHNNKAQNSQQ